jgi:hypothetical protein
LPKVTLYIGNSHKEYHLEFIQNTLCTLQQKPAIAWMTNDSVYGSVGLMWGGATKIEFPRRYHPLLQLLLSYLKISGKLFCDILNRMEGGVALDTGEQVL